METDVAAEPQPAAPLSAADDERCDAAVDAEPRTATAEGDDDAATSGDEDFLGVVVTSVEHSSDAAAGVTHAIASSLSSAAALSGFTVELVVTRGASSYCVERPLAALFDALHGTNAAAAVTTKPEATLAGSQGVGVEFSAIPEFPPKSKATDALIAQWCGSMTAFLDERSAFLKQHPLWLAFVEEASVGRGSRAHMTAIEFILQPFPYDKIYIPRGSQHEVEVKATKEGQFVVWKFEIEDFDVDFSVQFKPSPYEQPVELVHSRTRYMATTVGRPVEGMYQCTQAGKAIFVWDNSYSRIRGKNILYQVQVVDKSIMDSANTAADALDEAMQAKKRREPVEDQSTATTSTAIVVSSPSDPTPAPLSLYRSFIPETLIQQGWLLSAPINVAGNIASRLFGSQPGETSDAPRGRDADSDARSLLEELNGLNMKLMERMESLEDKIVQLTVERDQARSRTQMATVEKENTLIELNSKDLELSSLKSELQRMQREREAWREIQTERDALLEEKHRWAMTDFIGDDSDVANPPGDLDAATRLRLEHELGQAEAAVLRCRAELGYPLSNHLTGTSNRLEKIAQEMAASKRTYEDQMKQWESETLQLKQQLVKHRGQKRVLITEIRNMKTQTEGQVSVAMAEASEARMVNRRLKKQNELLLTQIRTLINDADENERKLREIQDHLRRLESERLAEPSPEAPPSSTVSASLPLQVAEELARQASASEEEEKPPESVPYTLSDADIALLNGQRRAHEEEEEEDEEVEEEAQHAAPALRQKAPASTNPFRPRLVAFFEERDPEMLSQVDEMLESYRGVEDSLFESLELKYSFMEINQRIAQAL